MNAAYAYNNQEAAFLITNRIYYLLEQNHWSVKTLSDKSNIPYETLKKLLSRKTENTSFHNIMKIALAFNCNLNYLVEPLGNRNGCEKSNYDFKELFTSCNTLDTTKKIPVYYPDSSSPLDCPLPALSAQDTLGISSYPKYLQQQIHYGIAISTYTYHPVYTINDVLLISNNRSPLSGETGIFFYRNNLYIRVFSIFRNFIILEPINGIGTEIIITDFSQWKVLGYVIGVHKTSTPFLTN